MKKKILTALSILILTAAMNVSYAKTTIGADLAAAIKMYKAGNYTECYVKVDKAIAKDPSNALAYYYKAMSATQIGKKDEAIENYQRALNLAPQKSNVHKYAEKGKRCIETPDKCQEPEYTDEIDKFIRNTRGQRTTDEVKSDYERLKLENLMREINRKDDVPPAKFKEFKDFSSMNNSNDAVPTNDEIVAAMRTLQKAGLFNTYNNMYSDLSVITGQPNQNAMINMMGNSNLSPQVIQALLTNNMSMGF